MNEDSTAHNQGNAFQDFENCDNSKPARFIHESKDDRLIRDMNRSPMETHVIYSND